MKRREHSRTEQLRQALEEREAQLAEANARLAALEGSTSLQVGRALTAAAKSPRRGLARLPRDLYRLWRGSAEPTARRRAEPVLAYAAERHEARLLSGAVGAGDGRLVIAGVLSAEARAAVEPYARLVTLRPHDAALVFDSADVDLLLVTASAAAGGPWMHVGDPAVTDRTRALNWVLESAAARGIPAVLLLDEPSPPGLRVLGFTHVQPGGPGIPLHRFNPVAAAPERRPEPVWLSGTVARPRSLPPPSAVAELISAGRLRSRETRSGDELAEAMREAAGVVTDDPDVAIRALVSGARVLLLETGAAGAPPAELAGSALRRATAPEDTERFTADVAELRAAGPLSPEELRAALRTVFLRNAAPVRLASLMREAAAGTVLGDPLAARRTALLAAPADPTESMALADDVLGQEQPLAEVILPETAAHLPGVERLRRGGIPLRTAALPETPSSGGAAAETATWARLAEHTDAPWVALWRFPAGAAHVADTLCAAECSGADAVGTAVAAWGPPAETVDWADADQDYVFVQCVRPDLARRDLVATGLHPGIWTRHGKRSLALARAAATADLP